MNREPLSNEADWRNPAATRVQARKTDWRLNSDTSKIGARIGVGPKWTRAGCSMIRRVGR
jgi:hypothetical protein